ncbi:hypothetical protein ACFO3O_19015 [Dokdonia ponticola]|uniref:Uncharacterized protein n=1 Tax=Dokdonia ponticola TaxID=2041041 RepID=A0ABV9I1D8_9FLAO
MKDIIDEFDETIDYFIVCKGSDRRAYEVLRMLENKSIKVKKIIFFDFKERFEKLNEKGRIDYDDYPRIADNEETIKIDKLTNSLDIIRLLEPMIVARDSNTNFFLDITAFIKPHFFVLIKLLKGKIESDLLNIFYSEPEYYKFNQNLYDEYEYLKGSLDIQSIHGYLGSTLGSEDRILTILLGFEGNISSEIYEDVAPSNLMVINGLPSYLQKFKDISILNNSRLIANTESIIYANANDPFKMYNKLSLMKVNNEHKSIVIAPLGTKPMALGACMFALKYPEIRIIYPFPENFNTESNGNCSTTWLYRF